MPVQFIGGSSGGGGSGTTDVRTTFAPPVLYPALVNTTTIVAQYQIPANYLTTNDTLSFKYIAQTGTGGNNYMGAIALNFYIGNTGTLADSKINIEQATNAAYYYFGESYDYPVLFLNGDIYFEAVGVSGLVTVRHNGHSTTARSVGVPRQIFGIPTNRATVDTTQPVYISLVAVTPAATVVNTLGSHISIGY